jgi:hypothetical protein
MDFNSIFGRAPSGISEGLERYDDDTAYAYWAEYIYEVATYGRNEPSVKIAQSLHRKLTARLEEDDHLILTETGLYKQSHMLDRHQTLELLSEIEAFVRSRDPLPAPRKRSKSVWLKFLHSVNETYGVLIHSFFQGIYEAEQVINQVAPRRKDWRSKGQELALERATEKIATLYDQFNNDFPKARARYEALKADVKSQIPHQPRLHYLIDKMVELFVYDPYELGILYIRRHHPGTIGAFHGLEEECE